MKIIVSGMIGAEPHQGGATWAVLQYVLGLQALGHETYFVEAVSGGQLLPEGCSLVSSVNGRYFRQVVAHYGLKGSATLLHRRTHETIGLSYAEVVDIARNADLLINISGLLDVEEILEPIPIRVYLDLDPAFVQLWHSQGVDVRFLNHTHFVTIGQAIGSDRCTVPDCNREWIATLQPVLLDNWPVASRLDWNAMTTVGNWRAYGSIEYGGTFYGQKAHSLRQFFELPQMTDVPFCMAMSIHPREVPDIEALHRYGWNIIDPARVASTPWDYQRFVQGSWAEFGIAKSGYVTSRCGWFSDRSICYLASGRPVVAQDTGFSEYLPVGEGLLSFNAGVEVVEAIQALRSSYDRHAAAARHIAESFFDSRKVLPSLLNRIL